MVFVGLYHALGSNLTPFLHGKLTLAQEKLITIYIHKSQNHAAGGAALK